MIWHIFKKDFKLLWPYAAMFAALQILSSVILILKPLFDNGYADVADYSSTNAWQMILVVSTLLAGAFLIALLVHQDALPGVRQDWLIRPISRTHLLLSKILSVVLLIHVPMLAADLLYALACGFPPGAAFGQSAVRNILLLMMASFPLLAFASMTKNLMEAIVGVFVIALSFIFFMFATEALRWRSATFWSPTDRTGLQWVPELTTYSVAFVSALVVLYLQYFRRKTSAARLATAVAWILVVAAIMFFPWNAAVAVDQQLSRQPGAGSAISFTFDPIAKKVHRTPTRPSEIASEWYLPLRIDGLTDDTVVRVDRSSTRVTLESGESMLASIDQTSDFLKNGTGRLHVAFEPRPSVDHLMNDERFQKQPMQVEIEVSATVLRRTSAADTSLRGPLIVNGVRCLKRGWMTTSDWDDDATAEVSLTCSPVLKPVCYSLTIFNPPAPYEWIPVLKCPGDYRPFGGNLLPGGQQITAVAHLRDPAGVVRYPEGTEHLFESKMSMNSYEPVDHFTRTIVIPNLRFNDWTPDLTP